MRAIIQRVSSASVTGKIQVSIKPTVESDHLLTANDAKVDAEVVSRVGEGLAVLVGLGTDDTPEDVEYIAQKILNVKAFQDATSGSSWKASVKDIGGDVLCVSQFTLLARLGKSKPDFHRSMPAESSESMYEFFLRRMGALYDPQKIKDGRFGAMMSVSLTNEGPVTFMLDSRSDLSDSSRATGSSSGGASTISGQATPSASGSTTPSAQTMAAQKAAEKALRRAAWESAKKKEKQEEPPTAE